MSRHVDTPPASRHPTCSERVLFAGLASLAAAQILGFVALRRRGYELLAAIGMLLLSLPPLAMALHFVLEF